MREAEFKACTACGNLHMEGGSAPDHLEECVVCEGPVTNVELDDLLNLDDIVGF